MSTYADTGYSFTHQLLYQIAARTPGVFPDLAYLPPPKDAALMSRDGIPWLLGTQTKRGAVDFGLLAISNSIVQELINVPTLLERSGIPLTKRERLDQPDVPLVLLGGANALYSSCLWLDGPESAVDGIFVGEDPAAIRKLLELARDLRARGAPKSEVLAEWESVPGFYQPDRPRKTRKSFVWDLEKAEPLEAGPVYFNADALGSAHLQISEGCPCFCSFCAESWDRKPYRERKAPALRETALRAKASMGLDTIEIYSFNFNMHSELYDVLWDLTPGFRSIGLKSQRFDLLANDPEAIEFQHVLEKTSLTCGLEGVSERLRAYLNKTLSTQDLLTSLKAIFKSKARELKVFLIATGFEEKADFDELAQFIGEVRDLRRAVGAGTRVIFSMTPLVRFPWTPLEFEDAPGLPHYDRILRQCAALVRGTGFEFRESADLPEYWVSQILVRAAQSGVSRALRTATKRSGFVYYREIPESFRKTLEQCLVEEGLRAEDLLCGSSLDGSRTKPWAAIETGVHREFLWSRLEELREFSDPGYCLGRSWKKPKCHHCGGCPSRHHVKAIVLAEQKRDYSLQEFKDLRKKAREREVRVDFEVEVGEKGVGVPRKMLGVALARTLMLHTPEIIEPYRGYAGALFEGVTPDQPSWARGDDSIGLLFRDDPGLAQLRDRLEKASLQRDDDAWLAAINRDLVGWATLRGLAKPRRSAARVTIDVEARGERLEEYLKSRGLKFTLKKDPAATGRRIYELTLPSLKKGILHALSVQKSSGASYRIEATPGPKFDLNEFLSEAIFATGTGAHPVEAKVEVRCSG